VRSLVQTETMKFAALASCVTVGVCYPRLAMWTDRPYQLWFLCFVLGWAAFMLWSFIFAWHRKYTGEEVLMAKIRPSLWAAATVAGLIGSSFLLFGIDSVLRPLAPEDYPATMRAWLAMTLFILAFDQLFLCFAPFAFFVRLVQRRNVALGLTVLFGVFLMYLKARSWHGQFSALFIMTLFAWRIVAGYLSVHFYLNGGVALTWWWVFLLQLRHLVDLLK
jgi:hypothetical protein